jgi:alkylation response protein AidB-like acyl-CoA dehydrogenase
MLVTECAKFCENTLAPLATAGDANGAKWLNGNVTGPKGWKEAYAAYAEAGWQGLTVPEKYGGQGMPQSLGLIKAELVGTANWTWGMYPGLALGAANTLLLHASEAQKAVYLKKLAEGTWLGTMCLTEPHCGTDLGQMRTKAEPQADGTFKITGTKIFISCGEHDFTENIVHIVLARLPNAPPGTKGISLFIVPKYLPNADGSLAKERNIKCGSIEDKMGIHGSSTCVMNFDASTGFIIGEPNNGLKQMFTFMNTARIGTAIQGVGASELAYQNSVPYTKERMSGRAMSGTKQPELAADPIIHHGDVRRMLLTQRAFAEGGRSMLYDAAKIADGIYVPGATKEDIDKVEHHLGLFTPILKGFLTETSLEAASLGMQVWGGHGYIRANGVEQIYRDARIGTLYEGTTGIQALDLLGRKVMLNKGKLLREYISRVGSDAIDVLRTHSQLRRYSMHLLRYTAHWFISSLRLMAQARSDREVVSSAANDFLMFSGYVSMAHHWLRMMAVAQTKLNKGGSASREFYEAKIATGVFYFENLLPRAEGHRIAMRSGSKTVTKMPKESF